MIDRAQVEHVANLARLQLSEAEVEIFAKQLNDILQYVEQLNQLDPELEGVAPTTRAIEGAIVPRADEVRQTIDTEALLNCAPAREDTFFRVPQILN
ncbi:MAG: Asp-tRNA(Asn)/Glu-tRNA(Gln) amidotransferase subunit GatC [Pseudanabaenaceae cyanobacterium SKYGB_i_bin29]|nr:Asp-tRNA(Asn)/Glu-tRNA(Gln) amidotransferase subunit GatC [Pseudanabaenaceae cyanobacterium SKYG29]MDW8421971.1 Asp-tRNA(Asn)/Glu-tRNA(Gln) amidotransferase subunit GatC [Pseudanabaenaceae cyanobacterium SKYGB_i_bin29]